MRKLIMCAFMSLLLISCEEIISVQDISDNQISLLAPASNSELEEGDVSFTWSSIDLADSYEFQIGIPDFINAQEIISNIIISDSINSTLSTTMSLNAGEYSWRVRAMNNEFETDYTTSSFTIVGEEIPVSELVIELTAPEDNLETTETTITFSWEAIEAMVSYRLVVLNEGDNEIVFENLDQSTSQTITLTSGTYLWKVRGENDTASTLFSEERTIIVQ